MILDHEAILKAYPEVVSVRDGDGAFKSDGTKVTLEQSKIDAARISTRVVVDLHRYNINERYLCSLWTARRILRFAGWLPGDEGSLREEQRALVNLEGSHAIISRQSRERPK